MKQYLLWMFFILGISNLYSQDYFLGGNARQLNANVNTSSSPNTNFTRTGPNNIFPNRNYDGCNCIELTSDDFEKQGRVFALEKINLNTNFTLEFDFYLGDEDVNGADGMVLFLHNDPRGNNATGTFGEGLGYGPRFDDPNKISPSVAFEIDTWENANKGDPVEDHLALLVDGDNDHRNYPPNEDIKLPNLENNQLHRVKMEYNFVAKQIRIFFNGQLQITRSIDLANMFQSSDAFWGVTAGTGGAKNQHYFCNPNGRLSLFSIKSEFSGGSLCSGQKLVVSLGNDPASNFAISWRNSANPNTEIASGPSFTPTASGSYFARITPVSGLAVGCPFDTQPLNVTLLTDPPPFNNLNIGIEPGTSCNGGSVNIRVDNTQLNVNYELINLPTNVRVGNVQAGNGASLFFPTGNLSNPTNFKIVAKNSSNGCAVDLLQTAQVNISSSIAPSSIIIGNTSACTGENINLTADEVSAGGTVYTWSKGGTVLKSGTGEANRVFTLSNASQTDTGQYQLVVTKAGCTSQSTFAIVISTSPNTSLNVLAQNSTVCAGSIARIVVQNSQPGVKYQLREGSTLLTNLSATKNGNGSDIVLETNTLTANTIFNVLAIATGCTPVQLTATVAINVSAPPVLTFTGNTSLCEGQTLILTANQAGASSYIWRKGFDIIGTGQILTVSSVSPSLNGNDYSLEINNGSCNAISSFFTVNVLSLPVASLPVTGSFVCTGTNGTITIQTTESGVNYQAFRGVTSVGNSVAGGGTITLTIPSGSLFAGDNLFTIRATRAGCNFVNLSNQARVNVGGVPNNALQVSGNPVCLGENGIVMVTASQTGVTYQAFIGATAIGSPITGGGNINFAIPAANLNIGNNFVSIDATRTGCATVRLLVEGIIFVNTDPLTNLQASGGVVCSGENALVNISNTESTASYQAYLNGNPVGDLVTGGGNKQLTISTASLNPGSNELRIRTAKSSCAPTFLTDTALVTLVNAPVLTLAVAAENSTICFGTTTKISVQNTETNVFYQLRIGNNNFGSAFQGNGAVLEFLVSNLAAGKTTFNVLATKSGCGGRQLNQTVEINVVNEPNPDLATVRLDEFLCIGNTGTTIRVFNTEMGVNYQLVLEGVNIGNPIAGNNGIIEFQTGPITKIGTNIFKVIARKTGCNEKELLYPADVTVLANPNTVLNVFALQPELCLSNTGTSVIVANSELDVKYQLFINNAPLGAILNGNGGNLNLPTGVLNTAGNYTFTLKAQRRNCSVFDMTNTVSVQVAENPKIDLNIDAKNQNLCFNDPQTAIRIFSSENDVKYQLQTSTGVNIGTAQPGNGGTLELPTGNLPTGKTIFQILANRQNCAGFLMNIKPEVNVNLSPALNLNLTLRENALCAANSGTVVSIINSEINVNYQLVINGVVAGNVIAGNGTTLELSTGSLPVQGVNTIQVNAVKADCNPVKLTQSVEVNITAAPDVNLDLSAGINSLCNGNTGTNITLFKSEVGVSYQLMEDKRAIGPPLTGNGANLVFPTGAIVKTGVNSFVMQANKTGCLTVDLAKKINITLHPDLPPAVNITGYNRPVCENTPLTLRANAVNQGNNPVYQWKVNGVNIGGNTDTFTSSTLKNDDAVTVTLTSDLPCTSPVTSAATVIKTAAPQPVQIQATALSIAFGFETTLRASGALSYQWEPKELIKSGSPSGNEVIVNPTVTTTFTVIGTDLNGCSTVSRITIKVGDQCDIFIPSLFSPNGDDNNETFLIYGKGIAELILTVYDRNGNLVFSTNSISEATQLGWDGKKNGEEQPIGKYIWTIKGKCIDGRELKFQGQTSGKINLMR